MAVVVVVAAAGASRLPVSPAAAALAPGATSGPAAKTAGLWSVFGESVMAADRITSGHKTEDRLAAAHMERPGQLRPGLVDLLGGDQLTDDLHFLSTASAGLPVCERGTVFWKNKIKWW